MRAEEVIVLVLKRAMAVTVSATSNQSELSLLRSKTQKLGRMRYGTGPSYYDKGQ